jgi:molecular chaperone HtpG
MKEEKIFKTESKELLNLMINSIYSNREIFLRELISNASDAIDKYKFLAIQSEGKVPQKDYEIRLTVDKKNRWLQVSDNGIGMSKADLEKNLGTIAKSGTKEFLEKYKEMKEKKEDVDLIGQFGVGFYSAFMVAKKIEVYTKDVNGNAAIFSSNGVETYTIEDDENSFLKDSGSAIRVYLKDDKDEDKYSEFLEDYEIRELVKKYSDFIRYPIRMMVTHSVQDVDADGKPIEKKYHDELTDETLNSMVPIWKKQKKDVTETDLNEFYKSRFHDYEDPLLSMNIKAEGTLEYSALVFIPKHVPYNLYAQDYEKGLALYAKGIFIEEKNKELVPDYLKFMRGLIDSEDLQLNISREMLQKSPILEKIAKNIEKKVVDRLKQLKDEDYDKYLEFFKNYGDFLKFGIYSSYGMKKEELQDLLVFDSLNGDKQISLKAYKEAMKEGQKNIYYASGKTLEAIKLLPEIARYKKLGYDVLLLHNQIDEFTLSMMNEYDKTPFKNITSEQEDELSKEEKDQIEQLSTENKGFLEQVKNSLSGKVDEVSFSLHLEDAPVSIVSKDGLSLNMENVLNSEPEAKNNPENRAKATKVLQINPNHLIFNQIKTITNPDEISKLANVFYDEAMMLEGFEIEDKQQFINNLNDLLGKAYSK